MKCHWMMNSFLMVDFVNSKPNIQTIQTGTLKLMGKKQKQKQTGSRVDSPQKKKKKSSIDEDSWTCDECGMSFTRKGNLKRQYVNKHGT